MFDVKHTAKELTHGFKIPAKPQVLAEIGEAATHQDFALTDLGPIISKDVGLSSAVLQVINASANGLNRTINDISQAVCFLGLEQVKAIVSIYKLRQAYDCRSGIKLERFWDEASETASTMLFINKWLGNKYQPDSLYTLGLFHNCGIAAMAFKYDNYMEVLQEANDNPSTPLFELEDKYFKTNHCTVGYFIASSWHLPKTMCAKIRFKNDMEVVSRKFPPEAKACIAIMHIAENLIRYARHFETSDWYEEHKHSFLAWLELSDEDFLDLAEDIEATID